MSEFATPQQFIKSGFARIEPGLSMGWWTRGGLYSRFERAHRAGMPEVDVVEAHLRNKTWAWPWFDRMANAFMQADFWPNRWTALGIDRPGNLAKTQPRARAELLADTIASAVYVDRDMANLVQVARDTGWKLELVAGDENCPVEAHFVKTHKAAIARKRYNQLPPYFPGDSCSIRILK